MAEFVKNIDEIRERARRSIEEGPVTEAYHLDKKETIHLLNDALATEIVCVLRYMHHFFMATGVHGQAIADEFKEHADAERNHADALAGRIQQLGGKPDYNPGTLVARSAAQYIEGETLADMIREDLVAERVVIELYTSMIRFFGDKDPTTRVLMEGLLRDEEEHAADLTDLLYVVEPATGEVEGIDPGTHPLGLHPKQRIATEGGPNWEEVQEPLERRPAAEVQPAHAPGTTGHPTRERPQQLTEEELATTQEEGAQMGATRAVRITRPNRKRRVA